MSFRRFYMWIRKHLLGIDDRSALERAIANGMKVVYSTRVAPLARVF